ncbi:hypothetical protein J8273_6630 [Carpediemonas membranifera]|uniref:Endonuclease/exonuclease/phosphatase domain-containing protein n=1 Tax=Carpediemonas membranifera TaxID=201153 RepID=A0A8J6B398_9EUKA|nr:hypothetical protein J8273_6630 [Carpediemonas membranifera]|eukprot:KAG9392039.1 hypothetical protein J8273_6630 [Carpediemonas membranifera]
METFKILSLNTQGHIGRGKDFTASIATAIQTKLRDIEAVCIQETWRTANTRVHSFIDFQYALAGRETEETLATTNEKRKRETRCQHRVNRQLGITGDDPPTPKWHGTREGIGTIVSPHARATWDVGITDSLSGRVQASIMRTSRDIMVITVYAPTSDKGKTVKDQFRDNIQEILDMKGDMEAIIIGDWNMAPGPAHGTTRWKDVMDKHKLRAIIPERGTLSSGNTTPDFAMVSEGIRKAEIQVVSSTVLGVWGSAHKGVKLAWEEPRYRANRDDDSGLEMPGVHTWNMEEREGHTTIKELDRNGSIDQWEETIRACLGEPAGEKRAKPREQIVQDSAWADLHETEWSEAGNKVRTRLMNSELKKCWDKRREEWIADLSKSTREGYKASRSMVEAAVRRWWCDNQYKRDAWQPAQGRNDHHGQGHDQ